MAGSGAQSIAIDECMALELVGEIATAHHIGFIGNLHVTSVFFEETEEPVADVERCMETGQSFDGYVFGLGGPLTQHISTARFAEAIAAYQSRQARQ